MFKCWSADRTAALLDRIAADGHRRRRHRGARRARARARRVRSSPRSHARTTRERRRPDRDAHAVRSSPRSPHARARSSASTRRRCTSRPRWARRRSRCSALRASASGDRGWWRAASSSRRPSLPALRHRRLRRRQGLRMPDDAAPSTTSTRSSRAARGNRRARRRTRRDASRASSASATRPFGGAERFLENALAALAERDVAITLYTREWPQTPMQLDHDAHRRSVPHRRAVARHRLRARRLPRTRSRPGGARAVARATGLLRHLSRRRRRARRRGSTSACAARRSLTRLAVRVNPHHRYRIAIERRMYASARLKAVICNSDMVRDEIRERFGVPDERLHVVYNAVDSDVYSPELRAHRSRSARAARHSGCRRCSFLFVGSGFERKGVATRDRRAGAARCAVAPDRRRPRQAPAAATPTRARALGVRSTRDARRAAGGPAPYYGAADAFVLPTLYDPCPNAALEAMACALPIVTSTKSRRRGAGTRPRRRPRVRRRRCRRPRRAHADAARCRRCARAWARTPAPPCCRSPPRP